MNVDSSARDLAVIIDDLTDKRSTSLQSTKVKNFICKKNY